jgi:PHD/YefM family antitoxin component YafN of YafNO toxin-antitoxin module
MPYCVNGQPGIQGIISRYPVRHASMDVKLALPHLPESGDIKSDVNLVQGATAMLDVNSDINSLSNFKRNTPEFLRQLKETGHPVVLTINGKAELVVQDTASYQKLMELVQRAERMDALKASLDDRKAGKVIPAADVLAEMRQILDEKQGR